MTLLINAQSIDKTYGITPLFMNITLSVFAHEHLGLIGPNGSGKSTLLKMLMGLETPDDGKITHNLQIQRVYLAQEDSFFEEQTIESVLFGSNHLLGETDYDHQIREVSGEKIFTNLQQKVSTLSGGWRKRLAIVQALLKKPDLLFMDEPTNHLDLEGIIWLEGILKKANFAYILVTHDRAFLDHCANSIVELNPIYPEGYFKVAGNYSHFLSKRSEFIAEQINAEQILANKVRREKEWLQRGAKARTTKAQYRIDQAEQLSAELRKISHHNAQTKSVSIDFTATQRKTKNLLLTHQISISRSGKQILNKLDLKLSPGTCLGILGKNGSGKSTLLNLLNGSLRPDTGIIERADAVRIITFDQKREQLEKNQTLKQALSPYGDSVSYQGNAIHVAAWAKRFLFPTDQLNQSVSKLSGGEQARVLIANLILQPADILLLDEPTNDLDIPTLDVLEESLREFPGAIVLITHDRFLMNRLCNQLLYLDGEGHANFFSDYQQWFNAMHSIADSRTLENGSCISKTKIKKLTHDEHRELRKLPEKIEKAENILQVLQADLENPKNKDDSKQLTALCEKIKIATDQVEQLYQRWNELEQLLLDSEGK